MIEGCIVGLYGMGEHIASNAGMPWLRRSSESSGVSTTRCYPLGPGRLQVLKRELQLALSTKSVTLRRARSAPRGQRLLPRQAGPRF